MRGKSEEFVIEKIVAHRVTGSLLGYLTKFKGYRRPEWIGETDFVDTAVIERYFRGLAVRDMSSAFVSRLMCDAATSFTISSRRPSSQ